MAISVGTITTKDTKADNGGSGTSNWTVSITIDASTTLLVVAITNDAADSSNSQTFAVTWNGVSMTQQVKKNANSGASGSQVVIFTLANPDTGTHNIHITQNFSTNLSFAVIPVWGNDGTTPIDATDGSQTSVDGSITTVTDNALIINAGTYSGGSAPSVAHSETSQYNTSYVNGASKFYFGATLLTTTHGAINTGWTANGSPTASSKALAIIAIRPASSTAWTKDLTESITMSAALVKSPVRTLLESVTMTDSILKAPIRILSEALTMTDKLIKSAVRSLIESLTISDVLTAARLRIATLVETISINLNTALIDSYSETNQTDFFALYSGAINGIGQSFSNPSSVTLDSSKFFLKKTGSPTGNIVSKIYAISGTSGTNAAPTGSALATSDPVDASTLTTSYQLIPFTFSGAQRINLNASTFYIVTCEYSGGSVSNAVNVGVNFGGSASGNYSNLTGGIWSGSNFYDACFYIYAASSTIVELTKSLTRILPETTTITDFLQRIPARIFTESTTITDVFVGLRVKFSTLIESFTASDSLIRSVVKNLAESVTITAVVNRITARILTETATITDTVQKIAGRILLESTTLFDTLIRSPLKSLIESTTISDVITTFRVKVTTLTESFTVTDVLSHLIGHLFTESFRVIDTIIKRINGLLAIWSNKFTKRNTSYGDKFTKRNSSYSDKYSPRNTNYDDKYTHL